MVKKKEKKQIAAAGNRTRDLAIYVVFSSRQTGYFDFVQQLGEKTRKRRPMRVSPPRYEGGTRFSLRSNLVVSPPRELYLCSFWPNLTKSAFSQTRYTDSVLASLEPRLFHSKKYFQYFFPEDSESFYETHTTFLEQCGNCLRIWIYFKWLMQFLRFCNCLGGF